MELVMKEALSIRSTPESARFNRDNSYELPLLLDRHIQRLKGGASMATRDASTRMRTDESQLTTSTA